MPPCGPGMPSLPTGPGKPCGPVGPTAPLPPPPPPESDPIVCAKPVTELSSDLICCDAELIWAEYVPIWREAAAICAVSVRTFASSATTLASGAGGTGFFGLGFADVAEPTTISGSAAMAIAPAIITIRRRCRRRMLSALWDTVDSPRSGSHVRCRHASPKTLCLRRLPRRTRNRSREANLDAGRTCLGVRPEGQLALAGTERFGSEHAPFALECR